METHSVPPAYRDALAHGVLQANVELWATIRRRTLGDYAPINEPSAHSMPEEAREQKSTAGPLFSEMLPGFLRFMEKDRGWRGQTLAQNQATYRMFVECCGDRPLAEYQRKDLAKFYDLIRSHPALYSKKREWNGLTLSEIATRTAAQDLPRVTMTALKRHFSALGPFFDYAKRRGEYDGENPAHDFKFPEVAAAVLKSA